MSFTSSDGRGIYMNTTNGKGNKRITAKELIGTTILIVLMCSIDSITEIAFTAIGL
jgi:hypothetical protein